MALALAACSDETVPLPDGGRTLSSFKVFLRGELGTVARRRPLSRGTERLRVDAMAVDALGRPLTTYSSKIDPATGCCVESCPTLRVTPGRLVHASQRLLFKDGVAVQTMWTFLSPGGGPACTNPAVDAHSEGGLPVDVERVFSDTVLWVEESGGAFASGMGGPTWFADPSLVDIQYSPLLSDNTLSPLSGSYVRTGQGDMIVTAIFAEGFYLTDLAARGGHAMTDPSNPARTLPGHFDSLYLYNFSYPDNLRVGDRVTSISGTCTDFSGATQLAFPSWTRDPDGPYPWDIPAPKRITKTDCNAELNSDRDFRAASCGYFTSNWFLESLESAIVCATVKVSEEFEDCDLDGNGEILNANTFGGSWNCVAQDGDGSTDAECVCAANCVLGLGKHAGKVCTELSTFRRFGQWIGAIDDGDDATSDPRILVLSKDGAPLFDVRSEDNAGRTVSISGPLRQVRAARPRWLIQVTDEDSLCLEPPCPNYRCE